MRHTEKKTTAIFSQKTTALLLTLVFSTTTVLGATPLANPPFPSTERNLITSLQIPAKFGTVSEYGGASEARLSGPVIIHSQDAHGQFDAQENIKLLLRHLERDYGFRL